MDQVKEINTAAKKTLPADEVAAFCRQTAMILKSGIFLYDGMEVLYRSYQDTPYGAVFGKIFAGVRDGGTLYDGVRSAGIFPGYMVQMVHVGEMTGNLDSVLERLADYYEKEDRLRSTVRSAVVYPLVLVAMLAVVIGILVMKVLPIFSRVFRSLGVGADNAVLSGGVLLGKIMLVAVALLLAAALALLILWKSGGRGKVLALAGRLSPRIRSLMRKQSAQRFAQVISMVLASGYSLEKALEMLPELMSDPEAAENATRCRQLMQESGDFAQTVEQMHIFDPLQERMVRVGAETGRTDQVLANVADMYEEEVTDGIQAMAARIEPALVALLTVIIGGILLSVMLPLAGILTTLS